MKVLILRSPERAQSLRQKFVSLGIVAVCAPTIAIAPLAIDQTFSPNAFDALVFTSVNAVLHSPANWFSDDRAMAWLAIGHATQTALAGRGVRASRPREAHSEAMVRLMLRKPAWQRIGIVTGEGGRALIAERLQAAGRVVQVCCVYQRVCVPTWDNSVLRPYPDILIVPSVSALENLQQLLSSADWAALQARCLIAFSERIAVMARTLGFVRVQAISSITDAAVLAAVQML